MSKQPSATGQGAGEMALAMLEALARRGPDSAGAAVLGPAEAASHGTWSVRIAGASEGVLERVSGLGQVERVGTDGTGLGRDGTLRFDFRPASGVTADDLERALGAHPGGLEVLSLGRRLDLVKQVGAPSGLEAAYELSGRTGPLAIGHTRMCTESRIDLSHSQPFWVHGVPDLATVHNGHITNYHQLRRRFEQRGTAFYTENDSEVIGVYLRSRMEQGRSLHEAMSDSIRDLDGSFCYIIASDQGLGIVRDRFGFKPMMLAETDDFVAAATEEVALRRVLPSDTSVFEPQPGSALLFRLKES